MKALALCLCVALSGAARAADPAPLQVDAPTSVVEIRVGDLVPFDGVLTEAGEYVTQAQGVADLKAERDALAKRPPLWAIVVGGILLLGGGVALGYGLTRVQVKP